MEPVTGQICVKTKYRECSIEQYNLIRDKATRAVQKILVVENPQCVKLENHRKKPRGKITFVFDITFMSGGDHESEPVMFTDGPVYECFERAVHKVLGAKKPVVKTYTATLRIRKDDNPEIHGLPFSASFPTIRDVQAQVRESVLRGESLFDEFTKAMISDAARTRLIEARTTGMPPCMAAPYGRTKTVNGHEVPVGITRAEYDAMPVKPADLWLVRFSHNGDMVFRSSWVSEMTAHHMDKGLVHLDREDAERHAMALFTPEKLEKPEDEHADIYKSARDAIMRDHAAKMKRVAAIRISNLRRNIKLDNDALKMIAPDGKTIIVNGHLVQRGITRAEYDAMPDKTVDLWLVRLHSCGDMVVRHPMGDMAELHLDKGLVHLDREDAECHARALFTPDELDVAGGSTNA